MMHFILGLSFGVLLGVIAVIVSISPATCRYLAGSPELHGGLNCGQLWPCEGIDGK